jgi:hypothetical protein
MQIKPTIPQSGKLCLAAFSSELSTRRIHSSFLLCVQFVLSVSSCLPEAVSIEARVIVLCAMMARGLQFVALTLSVLVVSARAASPTSSFRPIFTVPSDAVRL